MPFYCWYFIFQILIELGKSKINILLGTNWPSGKQFAWRLYWHYLQLLMYLILWRCCLWNLNRIFLKRILSSLQSILRLLIFFIMYILNYWSNSGCYIQSLLPVKQYHQVFCNILEQLMDTILKNENVKIIFQKIPNRSE